MLKVQEISKSYGQKKVLESISFQIKSGQIIGLVGGNGAGKSTLMNIIATLTKPNNGSVQLDGLDAKKNRKSYRQKIGYIPQEIAIWEQFTVRENMLFFEELSSIKKSESELRQLCLDMNLQQWSERADTLSGGQKRKLNIAIGLIHNPKLLLFDEPTVGIDMKSKIEIIEFIQEYVIHNELIALYISHDMNEIEALCDEVFTIGKDPFYVDFLKHSNIHVRNFI